MSIVLFLPLIINNLPFLFNECPRISLFGRPICSYHFRLRVPVIAWRAEKCREYG